MLTTVIINGVSYTGTSIQVYNNRIHVDGKDVTPEDQVSVRIQVTGNVQRLQVDASAEVAIIGNCAEVRTVSGSINISGAVSGDVVSVSGNVSCDRVGGKVKTVSGNIQYHN